MKIITVKNYQELSSTAGQLITDLIRRQPHCTLGLATGSTPQGAYDYLVERYRAGHISFREVQTFNLDEYCGLPRSHPQTYFRFMHHNMFAQEEIPPANPHTPTAG